MNNMTSIHSQALNLSPTDADIQSSNAEAAQLSGKYIEPQPPDGPNMTTEHDDVVAFLASHAENAPMAKVAAEAAASKPRGFSIQFPTFFSRNEKPARKEIPQGIDITPPNPALRGKPVNDMQYIDPTAFASRSSIDSISDSEDRLAVLAAEAKVPKAPIPIQNLNGSSLSIDSQDMHSNPLEGREGILQDMATKNRQERKHFPELRAQLQFRAHGRSLSVSGAERNIYKKIRKQAQQINTDKGSESDVVRNNQTLRRREIRSHVNKRETTSSESESESPTAS